MAGYKDSGDESDDGDDDDDDDEGSDVEENDVVSDMEEDGEEEGEGEEEDGEVVDVKIEESNGAEWNAGDHTLLLDQIQAGMPSDSNVKYSTMAEKFDWSRIKVGNYSPKACKEEWQRISTKLRRFRTMSELLVDAREWTKKPWNTFGKKSSKHPSMPKKPLTPYFRYFVAKRKRYSAKNPEMGATDLTRELSKKYGALSMKKKQKYIDAFNEEMEIWRASMETFRTGHPEVFNDGDESISSSSTTAVKHSGVGGPPKTITAMQIYINEKYQEEQSNKSEQSRKQLYEQYRIGWSKLPENKKLPYIDKAIEAKRIYDIEMEKYCSKYASYQPREVKTFLSKAEQKIKDKNDGKPEKPPGTGYGLFTAELMPRISDMQNVERLREVSRRWKELSEDKRNAYNLKADERNSAYRINYEKYLQSLPADARKKLQAEDTEKLAVKKKPLSVAPPLQNGSSVVQKPTKPVAAIFIFIADNKDKFKLEHPDMDDSEIQRRLVKDFNCLDDKEKAKYKLLEEQAKEKLARESSQLLAASSGSQKKSKTIKFPGEPPLPPQYEPKYHPERLRKMNKLKKMVNLASRTAPLGNQNSLSGCNRSGYQLFSKELLVKLTDVKSSERLQAIGKRWAALSEAERQRHNKRKDSLWTIYRRDVEKFKKTLTLDELKQFEEIHRPKKTKKKKKTKEIDPVDDGLSFDEDDGKDEDKEDIQTAAAAKEEDSDSSSSGSDVESEEGEDSDVDSSSGEEVSEAEEEMEPQLLEHLAQNGSAGVQPQVKSGRLSAADVYDDSSCGSSSSGSSCSRSTSSISS